MSNQPTGTSNTDDRLHELRDIASSEDGADRAAAEYGVDVTPIVERLGVAAEDRIEWNVDESDVPMLVFGRVDEADATDAAYAVHLREEGEAVVAPVPDPLLRTEPPSGLGLDVDTYDEDQSLLFEAAVQDQAIGLVPVRYGDGTPYGVEPLPETETESDPVAEETIAREGPGDPTPRPETVDAPIDPDVLEAVLVERGDVAESDVVGILEAIERHDLVGTGDHVADVPPLSVDDRAVCLLPEDAWTERLFEDLEITGIDVGVTALEAAREAHERQAARLIEAADAREFDERRSTYDTVITYARDTAEREG